MVRNEKVSGSFMLADVGAKNLLLYNTRYFLIAERLEDSKNEALGEKGYAASDVAKEIDEQLAKDMALRMEQYGGPEFTHYSPIARSYILAEPLQYTWFHVINTMPYFFVGSIRHYSVSVLNPFKERAGLEVSAHTNIANQLSILLARGDVQGFVKVTGSLSSVLIEIAYRALLLLLALVALCTRDSVRFRIALLFLALVGYFAILSGPVSFTRYRIVSEPYLLILATLGFAITLTFAQSHISRYRSRKI
jgi:hypothetical protein